MTPLAPSTDIGSSSSPGGSTRSATEPVLNRPSRADRPVLDNGPLGRWFKHVQARARAAMDAQVINEGRYQGGRPPYGYVVVDGGPHPNPRKAAEGYRLRVLAIEEETAAVVRRIFAEYLDDRGDRAIALGLNRDGIPCASRTGGSRTSAGTPMGGRGVRCAQSSRIRATPDMRSSGARPSRRSCSTPTTCRRTRGAISPVEQGAGGPVPPASPSGNRVGRGIHAGAAAPPVPHRRRQPQVDRCRTLRVA